MNSASSRALWNTACSSFATNYFLSKFTLCYFISFFQLRSKRPSKLSAVPGQWTSKRPSNEAESRRCCVKIIALLFIETGIWQHSIQMHRGVNWNKQQPAQLRLDMMMIITSPSMAMAASCQNCRFARLKRQFGRSLLVRWNPVMRAGSCIVLYFPVESIVEVFIDFGETRWWE